jgi:drug/metabolite transporter (DMT)-like permease
MRRRPSRKMLWLAIFGIAVAAVLLGFSGLGEAGRIVGGLIAIGSARDWSGYWAARDRFEAWRKRLKP